MSMKMNFNLRTFKWKDAEVNAIMRQALGNATDDALEYILGEANKMVPHDEGILQTSGDTDVDRVNAKGTVYYDTPYARRLHEHPEYRFNKGRRGKWLEQAFAQQADRVKAFMANKIRPFLR